MTDTEKIALISKMIADFWEYQNEDKINAQAVAFVNAINSVVDFEVENG